MNQSHEKLFTAFLEKDQIESDATQIAFTLKRAYPNCNLPVSKTIKRLLNGETNNPRESLLGFLAAFILNVSEAEVIAADQKNKLGDFYATFLEQYGKSLIATSTSTSPSVVDKKTFMPSIKNEFIKTIAILILCIAVLSLIGYILLIKTRLTLPLNIAFPKMITIKGGIFTMGDTFNDTDSTEDEKPYHQVILDSFEISQTAITFDLFDKYCIERHIPLREDLGWGRDNHPAIMMDWYEAVDFCNWLSTLQGLKPVFTINESDGIKKVNTNLMNNGYRLPTEAEWEYAASVDLKTNTKQRFGYFMNSSKDKATNSGLKQNQEIGQNLTAKTFKKKTLPVFESGVNQNGLYGMLGGIAEWCHDFYHPHFYKNNQNKYNPVAEKALDKDTSCLHVLRGGIEEKSNALVRTTFRKSSPANRRSEEYGFRVVKRNYLSKIAVAKSNVLTSMNE